MAEIDVGLSTPVAGGSQDYALVRRGVAPFSIELVPIQGGNDFSTRAALVSWIASNTPSDGSVLWAGGYPYIRSTGATAISDMANWLPAGEVFADHFGANTTPGTTDMTAAIQAALNYVGGLGGGAVNLSATTYIASGLSIGNYTALVGRGINATVLKLKNATNTYIIASSNFVNNSALATVYCSLRDMTLDGNNANNATGEIAVFCTFRLNVARVRMRQSGKDGFRLTSTMADGTTVNTNNYAEGAFFECHFDSNTRHGIYGNDGGVNRLADTEVSYCHAGLNGGSGIYFERSAGCKFTHNQIYDNGENCIYLDKMAHCVVSGNNLDLLASAVAGGGTAACVYVNSFSTGGNVVIGNNLFLMNSASDTSTKTLCGIRFVGTTTEAGSVHGNTYRDLSAGGAGSEHSFSAGASASLANIRFGVYGLGPTKIVTLPDATTVFSDDADPTKKAQFQLSGLTTATTRTYSLPDATGTLALNTVATTTVNGLVPAPGTATGKVLSDSMTWIAVSGGGSTFSDSAFRVQDNVDATKQLAFEVSGVTTATTRTVTVPDLNGTLALTSGAQTFSGKTFDNTNTYVIKDTLFTLQDDADATKQVVFQVSGLTTGTTRTISLPDASTTLMGLGAGQVVSGLKTFNDDAFKVRNVTDTTKAAIFSASAITTATTRTYTLPNADGTLVLGGGTASGTNTGDQTITLTGAVTGTGTGSFATTLSAGVVALSNMANLAANSFIGNNTGAAATPIAMTGTQATALLDNATTTTKGLVPAPGTATGKVLSDSLTWVNPAGGGDVTQAGTNIMTGSTTFRDNAVTFTDQTDTTKQFVFEASGITTGTTRTLTVPNASDTLAVLAATQNLTNKTLNNTNAVTLKDNGFTLQDQTDTTKQAQFVLNQITTGTTRFYSLPDTSTTLVGVASVHTITGAKTFNDNAIFFRNVTDTTKAATISLASITTGTTRNFDFPDASGMFLLRAQALAISTMRL